MSEATVLVVEDEASFVEALTIGLRREGFEVVVATDGVQALALDVACLGWLSRAHAAGEGRGGRCQGRSRLGQAAARTVAHLFDDVAGVEMDRRGSARRRA